MRAMVVALAFALRLWLPLPALGQGEQARPSASPPPAEPTPVPPAQISAAAEGVTEELRRIRQLLGTRPAIEAIEEQARDTERALDAQLGAAERELAKGPTLRELLGIEEELANLSERIQEWQQPLIPRVAQLQRELDRLGQLERVWQETRGTARREGLPAAVLDVVESTLKEISRAEDTARKRRSSLLSLQGQLSILQTRVSEVRAAASVAHAAIRESLLRYDSDPLWTATAGPDPSGLLREVSGGLGDRLASAREYLRAHSVRLIVHLLGIVALALALLRLRSRRAERAREGDEPDASLRLLARPYSTALVAGLVAGRWIYPAPPELLVQATGLVLLFPVLRLLPATRITGHGSGLYGLAAVALIGRWTSVVPSGVLAQRLLLLLEGGLLLGWLFWMGSTKRFDTFGAPSAWRRALGVACRAGAALVGVALAANLVGNVTLADFLTTVVFGSAAAAVLLAAVTLVAEGLFELLLRWRPIRAVRAIRHRQARLRHSFNRLLQLLATAGWIAATAALVGVSDEAWAAIEDALEASWEVGNLSLSAGGILAFVVTLGVALLAARSIGVVLEEDILPRLYLPRGIPYAIGLLARYAMVVVGVLLASSAAGLDVGRITLVIGALGVGIGLGLQNVVSNFVSGLVLLFERPIQVGDTVERGALTGEVKRIGIRSSTVRTWDGAEVIVPNEKLVSDEVVNWTLSDRQRRVELPVGAAYGSDPRQVLEILLGVARAHPETLAEPEPLAFFLGFGESALDFSLRCWVDRFEDAFRVRSELALALYDALRTAGIEIPFPQRDLHLRSIDPGAAEKLRR